MRISYQDSPQQRFAHDVVQQLVAAGYAALWAGGCVRDALLQLNPKDFDVATNARPEEVRALFGHRRTLAVGESFGVIVVRGPQAASGQVEVATFRTDGAYSDGRRPNSVHFATAQEDAQRRDFTINGLFYDPLAEQLIDYVGGGDDLRAGIVRAIGVPADRIREDKLRMIRAVRFAARFGFTLEELTFHAIRQLAETVVTVSQERITEELKRILGHPSRADGLRLLDEIGLLIPILPELRSVRGVPGYIEQSRNMLARQRAAEFTLSLALLFVGDVRERGAAADAAETCAAIGRRLRLSNQQIDELCWLLRSLPEILTADRLSLAELKRLLIDPRQRLLLEFGEIVAREFGLSLEFLAFCREYLQRTPPEVLYPPFLVTGADLIARGQKPGPEFARILNAVREAQLNEQLHSREQALQLTETLRNISGE